MRRGSLLQWLLWSHAGAALGAVLAAFLLKDMKAAAWLAAAVLAGMFAWLAARRISRPLEHVREGTERLARGEMEPHVPAEGTAETAALAEALNGMAAALGEKIRTLENRRGESEALLEAMSEGVLAVDGAERVLALNRAAAEIFGVRAEGAQGRHIQEVVRHSELRRLVSEVLAGKEHAEGEILLENGGRRFLEAQGTALQGAEGKPGGALLVLHDVTRLRRLEGIRRDFVANVSHEIRTPVTAIKGFVETLLDGGMQNPAEAERFLRIVLRHADRLNAIVEGLLALARIEEEERGGMELERGPLCPVMESAAEACRAEAAAKGVSLHLDCEPGTEARLNARLLEQALVNLILNAVRFSAEGQAVRLSARRGTGGGTVLEVRDKGCGIAPEHLPRIFERFYRADPSRGRDSGGTGLGLAIVKHIARAHGGGVSVESEPGRGSTFRIELPPA